MSPFDAVQGQAPAVQTLRRALARGRVHHAYRFEGPEGVGKELTAMALAQSLLCEEPLASGEACGACRGCHKVLTLAEEPPHLPMHPDLVVLQRGLYSKDVLGTDAGEAQGISKAQVEKLVMSRMGYAPHEARSLVFIVREAHELGVAAANALLKTLEEPAAGVHFLLVTSQPRRLLDTVRSRTLAVRFGALPDAVVADLLRSRGLDPALAPQAAGSASAALALGDPARAAAERSFVERALAAVGAPDLTAAFELVEKGGDRHDLRALLRALAAAFAERARQAAPVDADAATRDAQRHAVVLAAERDVERNVAPALAVEAMMVALRRG